MKRRTPPSQSQGFSMPEVLVSSALLAFVVANSASLYIRSGKNIQEGSLRDAIHARIVDDIEEVRRESWMWACEDGLGDENPWIAIENTTIPGPTPLKTACSGESADIDIPVAYKTGRTCSTKPCPEGEILRIERYNNACTNNMLAAEMLADKQNESPKKLATPTELKWTKNLPIGATAAPHTSSVNITRTISVNSSSGNQLDISYSSSASSPVQVRVNTSIVPQALSWCP